MSNKKVHLRVLGTGGTIAGAASNAFDNVGYTAAQRGIDSLIEGLPLPSNLALSSLQVAQVDSKDMGHLTWQHLLKAVSDCLDDDSVDGVVITHGTDTLEETAFLLHRVLRPNKPVVLTCAMRPATALMPDGPQNLMDAMVLASQRDSLGVFVVCAGEVHDPVSVQKWHTYRLNAFEAGEIGPMGHVREGRVVWHRQPPRLPPLLRVPTLQAMLSTPVDCWPAVAVLLSHAGVWSRQVDVLVDAGVAGLVVCGTGNGTIHSDLDSALRRAHERGVGIVRTSRCPQGPVLESAVESWPVAHGLNAAKARVALMLELLVRRSES
jgi:L-asparaginase